MIQRHAVSARILGLCAAATLSACSPATDSAAVESRHPDTTNRLDLGGEVIITDFTLGPPDARPGACYGKDVTPGVIEHVTERVLVAEAKIGPDGNVLAPARYEQRRTQKLVTGHEPIHFETPCPPRWTPEFIASIQRALKTRGFHKGPVTSELDPATRTAIRSYQVTRGLNSAILSTDSARALGLVEIDLDG